MPELATTEPWRKRAKAEIVRQFGKQTAFADWIGGSQAGVSQALSGKQPTTKYVIPMCDQLGLPYPTMSPDELVQRMNELAQVLAKDDREALEAQLTMLERLAKSIEKK